MHYLRSSVDRTSEFSMLYSLSEGVRILPPNTFFMKNIFFTLSFSNQPFQCTY